MLKNDTYLLLNKNYYSMNYMITKSKTRGAQPESPAPKKEHNSMLNATNEDKKRKLDTLKNCQNYNILETIQ